MSLLARRRKKATIDIIPLMDVLTILIFFFLVSMQFKEMTTLNLTLPRIESAGKNDFPERILIGIDEEGQIYLENQPIPLEQLQAVRDALHLPPEPAVSDLAVHLRRAQRVLLLREH